MRGRPPSSNCTGGDDGGGDDIGIDTDDTIDIDYRLSMERERKKKEKKKKSSPPCRHLHLTTPTQDSRQIMVVGASS